MAPPANSREGVSEFCCSDDACCNPSEQQEQPRSSCSDQRTVSPSDVGDSSNCPHESDNNFEMAHVNRVLVNNPSEESETDSGNVSINMRIVNQSSSSDDCNRGSSNSNDYARNSGSSSSHNSNRSSYHYDKVEIPNIFIDVKTQQEANSRWLHNPRVLNSLVHGADVQQDIKNLLEELQKNHKPEKRAALSKTVQTTLLRLAEGNRYSDTACFVKVSEHQSSAISYLEILLLDLQNSQDTSVTSQLLDVALSAQSTFLQLYEDNFSLLPAANLHLMAVSALLSRCPHPSPEQWSALGFSKKHSKKKEGESLKQTMVKAVQLFHEGLEGMTDKASTFQQWSQAGFSQEERDKRKDDFSRSSFCELIVSIFTLLSELKHQGRNEHGHNLLQTLRDVFESSARPGKRKFNEDSKASMEFFLVRGLVVLLKTAFEEDEPEVGEYVSEHSNHISRLIKDVINNARPSFQHRLVREVEYLPFHISRIIRKEFNDFFENKGQFLHVLAQGYMASNLQLIGFRGHRSVSSTTSAECYKPGEQCGWNMFTCTVCQKPAEGAMYIPKFRCLAGCQLNDCLNRHPGCQQKEAKQQKTVEGAQRHKHNLDMLKSFSPQCKYLLQLYSYQILPFPYYITEEVQQRRLLSHLLDHRNSQLWLDTPTLLCLARDFMEALIFLASRHLDPRDVTAYNMVVHATTACRRQSFGTRCSVLTCGEYVVKLADLGLAHQYLHSSKSNSDYTYSDEVNRPVLDQGPIPVRWTSPEALFKGHYGEKNMVYSAGCVLFELFTHGCQPYSSYDQNMNTEDILRTMLMEPNKIQLAHKPCIPKPIFDLIKQCTDHRPELRPSLDEVKRELLFLQQNSSQDAREPDLESALCLKQKYPAISPDQVNRRHVPETGIPPPIQDLINAGKKSELYKQVQRSMRVSSSRTVVTEDEFRTPDWIRIYHLENRTVVEELLTSKFVQNELPSLEGSCLKGVTCWARSEDNSPRPVQHDRQHVFTREYPASVSLKTAALKGLLWDSGDEYDVCKGDVAWSDDRLLMVLISLAQTLNEMHDRGWIYRDLKEDNILIDCSDGKVILPRIGRMHQLLASETFLDQVFEDSRRWLAPEVLLNKQYGKENDIFMLGTVMQQVFRIQQLANTNPSNRELAPYPNIEKNKVIDHIRDSNREEVPPAQCPSWLWDLSIKCLHTDLYQRPSAGQVLDTLLQHHQMKDLPFIWYKAEAVTAEKPVVYGVVQKSKPRGSKFQRAMTRLLRKNNSVVNTTETSASLMSHEQDQTEVKTMLDDFCLREGSQAILEGGIQGQARRYMTSYPKNQSHANTHREDNFRPWSSDQSSRRSRKFRFSDFKGSREVKQTLQPGDICPKGGGKRSGASNRHTTGSQRAMKRLKADPDQTVPKSLLEPASKHENICENKRARCARFISYDHLQYRPEASKHVGMENADDTGKTFPTPATQDVINSYFLSLSPNNTPPPLFKYPVSGQLCKADMDRRIWRPTFEQSTHSEKPGMPSTQQTDRHESLDDVQIYDNDDATRKSHQEVAKAAARIQSQMGIYLHASSDSVVNGGTCESSVWYEEARSDVQGLVSGALSNHRKEQDSKASVIKATCSADKVNDMKQNVQRTTSIKSGRKINDTCYENVSQDSINSHTNELSDLDLDIFKTASSLSDDAIPAALPCDSSGTLDRDPLPPSASSRTLDRDPVPHSASSRTLDRDPVQFNVSFGILDRDPVPPSASSRTLDRDPVPPSASSRTLDRDPLPPSASSRTLDRDPVPPSVSFGTLDRDPVQFSALSGTLDRDPVQFSALSGTLDRDPVQFSASCGTLDRDPAQFSASCGTLDRDPVQFSASCGTLDRDPVQFSASCRTLDRDPVQFSADDTGQTFRTGSEESNYDSMYDYASPHDYCSPYDSLDFYLDQQAGRPLPPTPVETWGDFILNNTGETVHIK